MEKISNPLKALIAVLILAMAGTAFYFFYWVKTPDYSLKIVAESAAKHDMATFNRHVDVESLLSQGYDDFITYQMIGAKPEEVKRAKVVSLGLKPAIIGEAKKAISTYVESGVQKESADDPGKDQGVSILLKNMGLGSSTYKGTGAVTKDGGNAIVEVKLLDSRYEKEFILKVKMTKLGDGTWQIVGIDNLVQYLDELEKAKKEKLSVLNKPIEEELRTYIVAEKPEVSVVPVDSGKALQIVIPMTFPKEKNIVGIIGEVTIMNGDQIIGQKLMQLEGSTYAGKKSKPGERYPLNPANDVDLKVLGAPAGKLTAKFRLVAIKFADGSEIKVLLDVPEPGKK